jgi:hypothetical protein
MSGETQISAYISKSTKEQLERYADEHGLKKGRLIEDALLHHLQALREVPQDLVIPTRLVVSAQTGRRIAERIRKPRKPTAATRRLFDGVGE